MEFFKELSTGVYGVEYGKPMREKVINEDDILNLRIALETAKSLEEFLEMV